MASFIGNIKVLLGLETGQFSKGVAKGKKELNGFQKAGKDFSDNMKGMLAGAFAVGSIVSFGKSVIDITGQFQRLEAVLTNTLGSSSAAQQSINMIKEFASKTPFAVNDLTESFVKLANQGFKPTADEMTKLGDLASSTGKGFDQLTEAIIDAQTGEFERLKEFGIRAEKQGDKVTFAFKGVKTQVDFTNDSIRNYILGLGDVEGVSGSMAAISETLEGKISNLGDSWDSLLNTIGSGNSGVLNDAIESLKAIVDEITETEIATNRAAKLGFGRKLFSEVDGLGAKMLEFDKQFQTAMSSIYNGSTNVDELKAKVIALKTQFDSLNKGTDEGRAKSIIYADGIKLLSDKIKELTISESNAANTTKQPQIRTIALIEEEIRLQNELIKGVSNRAGAIVIQERIKKLEKEKEAILGNNKALKEQNKLLELKKGLDFSVSSVAFKGLKIEEKDLPAMQLMNGVDKLPSLFDMAMSKLEARVEFMKGKMQEVAQSIKSFFETIAIEGLATFGAALGTAFAGGDVMQVGMQFAQVIADSIGALGKQLIAIGVTMTGIIQAISTAGWANPALVIGGGIALVALSSAMKGMMAQPTMFANGGLVTGATLGMVGEGIGTTRSNPEVIAPLDKLRNFMPDSGGSSGNVNFRIEGNTLVGILDRQQKTSKYSR